VARFAPVGVQGAPAEGSGAGELFEGPLSMAQKSGLNVLLIPLVLCVLIMLILVGVAYSLNGEKVKAEKVRNEAVAAREQAEAEQVRLTQKITSIQVVMTDKGDVDPGTVQSAVLASARKDLQEILNSENQLSEEFRAAIGEVRDVRIDKGKEYTTLTELIKDLWIPLRASMAEINRIRLDRNKLQKDIEDERVRAKKEKTDLEGQIEALRGERGKLQNQLVEAAKEADSKQRELQDQVEAVRIEKAKLDEEHAIAEARLKSEISRLEGRITELVKKEKRSLADTLADGEVAHADQKLGLAWIDLGRSAGVRRGLKFEAFQYGKGGVKKRKGKLEIRTVEDNMSQCAVIEQTDPFDPIVKGDLISSPLFDKQKQQVFVFIGDKLTNERYGMDELRRRIEENGAKVADQITVDTDFAVAIENAEQDPRFEQAIQFGVIVMREPELLDFLGR